MTYCNDTPITIPTLLQKLADDIYEQVEIVLDFPDDRLVEIEHQWGPERKRLPSSVEHRHWRWDSKTGRKEYRLVAVMNGSTCEGLLAVNTRLRTSRTRIQKVLYIGYIESAPSNHEAHPDGARFRGVGANLMMGAILLSQQTQAKGAIGLHSLDSSRPVYRKWGMKSFGRDGNNEDLAYFEFTSAEAAAFLAMRTR